MRAARFTAVVAFVVAQVACGGSGASGDEPQGPGPVDAARSGLSASPAEAVADGVAAVTLRATARDASGRAVPGKTAVFNVTGVANLLSSRTATTDASGVASVTLRSTRAEPKDAFVEIDGVSVAQHAPATFTPGAASLSLSSLEATPAAIVAGGAATTITVTVADAEGNPVPGVAVTLSSSQAGDVIVQPAATDADGVATGTIAGTVAGTRTVSGAIAGVPLAATAAVVVTAAAPSLATSTFEGSPEAVVADGSARAAFVLRVADAYGNPVAGVEAAFASTRGALSATSATTDLDGAAAVSLTSTVSGGATVTAAFGGLSLDAPATFVAGPAAALAFVLQPAASITAGTAFGVSVQVRDAYGNVVPSAAAISLSLSPSGTLLGTTAATANEGVATFPTLSVHQAMTGYALVARSTGLADAVSSGFAVTPAGAAALVFVAQPSDVVAGETMSPPVEVAVVDVYGNRTRSVFLSVALGLQGGAPGASLSGGGAVSAVEGVATFAGLSVDRAGSGYVLHASADWVTSATSGAFAVAPAAPSGSTSDLAASPASVVAGALSDLTATVRDALGNPVPGVAVALEASGGEGTLVQPPPTAADGTATGTPTATSAGTRTVTARLPGGAAIGAPATVTFVAGPASAAHSLLVPTPASAYDDGTHVALTATVKDAYGNAIAGAGVTFTSTGAATFSQPGATDASGVAIGAVGSLERGEQTITASVGSTAVATAAVTFTAAPPSAALSTVVADPASAPADGMTAVTVTVTARDTANRALSGAAVSLAYSGAASVTPASATTDAAGVATFALTASTPTSGEVTATIDPAGSAVAPTSRPSAAFTGILPTAGTVSVSGIRAVGSTLTASAAGFGPGNPAGSYHYLWERCADAGCTSSVSVGADAPTYTLAPADAGAFVRAGAYVANACASGCGASAVAYSPADLAGYGIAGTVRGATAAGVTVTLSGASAATTVTNAAGRYAFGALPGGSYTVTPSKGVGEYAFFPRSIDVTLVDASAVDQDFTATAVTTSDELAAVRSASGTGLSLGVHGAFVTYLKPAGGTASDPAGFFVQGAQGGPAVFVGIDPATTTPPLGVGDRVSFTATAVTSLNGLKEVTELAGLSVLGSGNSVSELVQDLSAASDLVTGIDGYESELVRLSGTIASAFAASGAGFVAARLDTAGVTGNTNLRLRIPAALQSSLDLAQGCTLTLDHGPMWRYGLAAQPSAFDATELGVLSCPAPRVISAAAVSPTQVVVTFDRSIDPATLTPNAFTLANGVATIAAAPGAAPRTASLTVTSLADNVPNTVVVASSVTDTYGSGVDAAANSATFVWSPSSAALVISQVYGGGGNAAGASYQNDYVELFNRSASPLSLAGLSVQYGGATSTSTWTVVPLSGMVQPGGYFLLKLAAGSFVTPALPTPDATNVGVNISASAGKLALVNSTTALVGAMPVSSSIIDLVGYGATANAYEGAPAAAASNTTALVRASGGCVDTNNNAVDFSVAAPAPRNSTSAVNVCSAGP